MGFRTDENNNPAAFTTDLAVEAELVLSVDYVQGDPFLVGTKTFYTAKLLGDPVATTIRLIDNVGFYTVMPHQRWTYMALPYKLWIDLTPKQKSYVIGVMYQNEGGTAMKGLFPSEPY